MASSLGSSLSLSFRAHQQQRRLVLCQACPENASCPDKAFPALKLDSSRRHVLLIAVSACGVLLSFNPAALALLEADDDEELLEKVKEDRKKKIKRRGEINSFKEETASLQAAIYQLSKAGQALDGNDFSAARKILGESPSEGWIADVEKALSKVSSSAEEQGEAKVFSSSLANLQMAVSKQDIDLSKSAFVKSAGALEKWSFLTGFAEQLKGL
ncbi:hypothetical protein GOP47_0023668 [Adiantum capillus-veneris]|uniref:Maintenance of Photosystem II under High light 2 C-terminal domain-containing protein n=1 Tax=Adiantum capillus-veneris TaxID=13818 RepID=A0A9D4Z3K9_ADICA|nr:hypothetical protein GOP47_0023668 [Adiantum capillus-veneris]